MRNKFVISGIFLAVIGTALPGIGLAQPSSASETAKGISAEERKKMPVTATFEFDAKQLRLIVGGSSGKGVLRYQGKEYPFSAKGGSIGGVGYTEVHATGTVHGMKSLNDFAGSYSAISIGAAVGKGKGASTFQNNKGVVLNVTSKTEGVALNLGVGVVEVTLDKK